MRKDDPEAVKLLALQKAREEGAAVEGESSAASSSASPAPAGKRRGPVRKRPRQSLEALAAAIDGGKKMTTLEKVSRHVRDGHLTPGRALWVGES